MELIINIINLDPEIEHPSFNVTISKQTVKRSREERIISICRQSKEQKFACRFWNGIIGSHGGEGISKAFKQIVQWAKDQKLPMVCIGEDDLLFSALGAWQYYLDNMPDEFDIYLGGVYSAEIEGNRVMNGYSGNTLITIKEQFYDFVLSSNEKLNGLGQGHLDRWLGCFAFEKNYRVCQPFVCLQCEGYSDNHRRLTQHSGYLEEMSFYGRDGLVFRNGCWIAR